MFWWFRQLCCCCSGVSDDVTGCSVQISGSVCHVALHLRKGPVCTWELKNWLKNIATWSKSSTIFLNKQIVLYIYETYCSLAMKLNTSLIWFALVLSCILGLPIHSPMSPLTLNPAEVTKIFHLQFDSISLNLTCSF